MCSIHYKLQPQFPTTMNIMHVGFGRAKQVSIVIIPDTLYIDNTSYRIYTIGIY